MTPKALSRECKHKYKIHETYYTQATTTGTNMVKRAIIVCEKCGVVGDRIVELY